MKFRLLLIIFIAFVAVFFTIVVVVWFEVFDLTKLQSLFSNDKMTTTASLRRNVHFLVERIEAPINEKS